MPLQSMQHQPLRLSVFRGRWQVYRSPLFAPTMYGALGYRWGNSVAGPVGVVIGIPSPFLPYMYGEKSRKMSSLTKI